MKPFLGIDLTHNKKNQENNGRIHCKTHAILEVRRAEETYGICLPPYEVPVFEALTGLKAIGKEP